MAGKKKKYYAVVRGRIPGLYASWEGGALEQVSGFSGASFKGFESRTEAEKFLEMAGLPQNFLREEGKKKSSEEASSFHAPGLIHIFSDGGALGNPGPGGYGVIVIRETGEREEFSGGFSLTTNNRMELLGAIVGLRSVRDSKTAVRLTSDSSYLVNGMEKGWAESWKRRGWRKADGKPALNPDLWAELLDLVSEKNVSFHWVRGHAGHPENERCDTLAKAAASGRDLPRDTGYLPVQDAGNLPGFD